MGTSSDCTCVHAHLNREIISNNFHPVHPSPGQGMLTGKVLSGPIWWQPPACPPVRRCAGHVERLPRQTRHHKQIYNILKQIKRFMGGNLIDKTHVYAKWHGGFVSSKIQCIQTRDSPTQILSSELFLAYTLISLSITTKRLKNTKVVTIEVIFVKIRNEWVDNWDGGGQ